MPRIRSSILGHIGWLVLSASAGMADPLPSTLICTSASDVSSFIAQTEAGGVRLYWTTLSEKYTVSFDVSRSSSPAGPFALISGQIPSAGTDTTGAMYEFLDPDGSAGQYYSLSETETIGGRGPCSSIIKVDDGPGSLPPGGVQVTPGLNPKYVGTAAAGPPYDALIICPDAWAATLTALRDHWSGFRHHATLVVTFSQAGTTKEAIRSYILSYAQVQYVLLVGDTENRLEPANVIPIWYVQDPNLVQLATDAPYGDRDSDGLSDIALGRWPAHTSDEVTICVNKSIGYDYQNPDDNWRRRWTGLVYDLDWAFGGLLKGIVSRQHGDDLLALTPWQSAVQGFQHRASEITCCAEARQDTAIAAVNAGTHVLWTVGTRSNQHSMTKFIWNGELVDTCPIPPHERRPLDLTRFDANQACGFWFPLTCDLAVDGSDMEARATGCGDPIWIPPIAEDLLLAPDRGALTWFSPSRGTRQDESYRIGREILSRLTYENQLSVGRVCMEAAQAVALADPLTRPNMASYVFLGDPTIVMAWTIPDIPTEVASGSGVRAYALDIRPNPGRGTFDVQFALVRGSDVTLSVYDVAGRRVRVLARGTFRDGTYRNRWDGRDESGRPAAAGIYLVQLRTKEKLLNQKLVLMH
jgi:hypothetical protein